MKLLSSIDENKDAVTKEWVEAKGYTTNTGTITGVQLNGDNVATSGIANIKAIPNTFGSSSISGAAGTIVPLVKYGNVNYNGSLVGTNILNLSVNRFYHCYERGATVTCNYYSNPNRFFDGAYDGYDTSINPSTAFVEEPFVLEMKKTSSFEMTDVSRLLIIGHRLYGPCYCKKYKIEVAYNYSNGEYSWDTVIDYDGNAVDICGKFYGLYCSAQGSSSAPWHRIFGIRLTISESTSTVLQIADIQLICGRGTEQPYEALHVVSDAGGTFYGNVAAPTFIGALTGTASKATGDKNGNDITTTYYKTSNPNGYTSNTGTITGVSVNGTSVATSGVANITAATGIKGDSESSYRTGNVNITKANIGLGNVENKSSATIRGELTSSNVTTALGYTPINSNLKGANNGLAELDANGKVPSAQLPSYVDDVIEYTSQSAFPTTGETGKIYIAQDTNKTYRWSGTAYVEISPSLALGETSSTAYRGDRGKVAYDHSQSTHARTDATAVASSTTNGNIKINGTETTVYSHPSSGVTAGTYKSVTVDGNGHVTGGSNPTTLSGYGITDAKINNGTITLGNNTITPLTSFTETDPVFSASAAADISSADISNWNGKQAALVSGTNIKTVNGNSLLGSGNITISGGSSSYNDLTNKPQINGNELSGNKTAAQLGFATVATSGSYNDLSNKPSIPTVNNGTLTIQKNGSTVATFTANQSGGSTANITVPGVYNGTGAPASTLGSDGDIYIQLG